MPSTIKIISDENVRDQFAGIAVDNINTARISDEISQLSIQNVNFSKAIEQVDDVRDFIGPSQHILGNQDTKHGEIAEHVEVGIRRARQALEGHDMTATFEGVGRTAPTDYIIDGIEVQSKFINGANNNLSAVLEHMDKYSDFGRDGSYYHIPKDMYEMIENVNNGDQIEGMRAATLDAIREKVAQIEAQSGRSFSEVVQPGVSNYAEVQQGKISETLNRHEQDLTDHNLQKNDQITQEHEPGLEETGQAAGIGGLVGGAISLTTALYQKSKEGIRFYKGEFSAEDWKEVGKATGKGAIVGSISGASIYALTNYASLSAPFAGAVVSATKGVGILINDLNNGKIVQEEFIELGMIICAESSIVGFATLAGQTLIPIPVLGAVIGSIAGSMLKNMLGAQNKKTAVAIRKEMEKYLSDLDKSYQELVKNIVSEFEKLGALTDAAFDLDRNLGLMSLSVDLARAHGVPESKIIRSVGELDDFMMR